MPIFLSPHNDDETLFGAFTLMQVHPLVIVCTDGYIQGLRGENVTAEQRREETMKAMEILGCEVIFLGIPDNELTKEVLKEKLQKYGEFQAFIPKVYEKGHPHHNIVGEVGKEVFKDFIEYHTYEQGHTLRTKGKKVSHNDEEMMTKLKALQCYKSQMELDATKPYFFTDNEEYYA